MEKLNLHDDIERNVVMEKICASTKKDKFGRRKSFRMTQQEIQKAIEGMLIFNFQYQFLLREMELE